MAHAVQFTLASRNIKVGKMPVSTTDKASCPDACPLKRDPITGGNGPCYAMGGPLGMIWDALSRAIPGKLVKRGNQMLSTMTWDGFCNTVSELALGTIWRHNQAGDLPGENDAIDTIALDKLVQANKGKRGFTYSHKPIVGPHGATNAAAIKAANEQGFTINLSGDNLREADELLAANIGPVVVVLPIEAQRAQAKDGTWLESLEHYRARTNDIKTPNGAKVAPCPATYRDDTACIDCQLCQRQKRNVVVGFPAHGQSKRKASNVAMMA